ncbi:mitochondrial-processing peptidase subunit alpha-like isoform X2 [Nymphaea colorata]|uniref:mitochondrial-processing peptidase subunit alpha-like isoform X2 n=1 Tax=Nymphaea colorata TaxID=210225 RepID=UPI00129E3DD6|nr:mitochondrial-processing peptidase subunit alpha-like isoform X2 [Nymphaea colorata]
MLRVARRFRPLKITENGLAPVRCTSAQVHKAQDILFNQSLRGSHTNSHGKSLVHPPLFHHLPGLKLPPCLSDYVEPCPTKITTLPNGLKIASENILGPAACIGLFVDCGSIYESEWSHGVTHLLERMAFKSTRNRSHLCIVREMEAVGGNVSASASREQMGYSYDVLKSYLPQAIGLLIDCVRNPLFLENEVKEQLTKVKREIGEISDNPQNFLLEALHPVGYSGALANSLMASESAIDRLDGSIIRKFVDENYTAERMVLAASGVDHEELLTIAEPLLCDVRSGAPLEEPRSIYVGGDIRYPADSQKTHVALAFEVPGGWREENDATAVAVLQTLMGGGGSFSAGGPGKGMHSRLYLRVLNKYLQIDAFSSFSSIYNQTGMFGIHITTGSDFVADAVEIATEELLAVAIPGEVTEAELYRAKNATRSAVLMNLESRMIICEDIGRQILTYGNWKPVEHFLKAIDELTLDGLTMIAKKIVASPLTMASWGDVGRVPSYDSVCQQFH